MKTLETHAPLLYSLERAASLLKISSRTLWRMCEEGRTPCVRIGARRLIAYSWLATQGVELPQGDDSSLIDSREASSLLGISPRHLWRFVACGEIPSRRIGDRVVRFSVAELRGWVDSQSKCEVCHEH